MARARKGLNGRNNNNNHHSYSSKNSSSSMAVAAAVPAPAPGFAEPFTISNHDGTKPIAVVSNKDANRTAPHHHGGANNKIRFGESPMTANANDVVAVINDPLSTTAAGHHHAAKQDEDDAAAAAAAAFVKSSESISEEDSSRNPPQPPHQPSITAEPKSPSEGHTSQTTDDSDPSAAPRPMELIRYNNETKEFEVGEAAMRVLAGYEGPVGVVAVCGRARQGKSYILNQLLGQSAGGFRVASTHRPCTKGLWMWSDPIKMPSRDHHMVLLDTEGIDAYDQTGQYSAQIFSLAVLLSSVFVYNQLGGIDEAALDRLSLVTEMTKHIRARANRQEGSAPEWELGDFTPSFIWLLRDFYLMLESEDGSPVTPREYLETALQPVECQGASAAAKNQIRSSIKALFPDRDCHALVRPVHDEKALQRLEAVEPSGLRPEFREGLEALTRAIFQRGHPKRVGGMTLTGPMLAGLTKAYVGAINDGAVPCILTTWQGVAEAECRRGSEAAEAEYARTFNYECGGEVEQLEAEHSRAVGLAARVYQRASVGDAPVRESHEQRWRAAVSSRFQDFKQRRLAEGAMACQEMLSGLQSRLDQMRRAGAGPEGIVEEFGTFVDDYLGSTKASGPTKWPRLAEFVRASFRDTVQDIGEKTRARQQELEERIEEAVRLAEEGRRQVAAAEERARQAQEEAVASRAQAEESRTEAEARRRSAEGAACRALVAQKKADASNSEAAMMRSRAAEAVAAAAESGAEAEGLRREAEGLRGEVRAARAAEAESRGAARAWSEEAKGAKAASEAARADARRSRLEASKCRSLAREADSRARAAEEEMRATVRRLQKEREEDKALKAAEAAESARMRRRRMVATGVAGWVVLPLIRALWCSFTPSSTPNNDDSSFSSEQLGDSSSSRSRPRRQRRAALTNNKEDESSSSRSRAASPLSLLDDAPGSTQGPSEGPYDDLNDLAGLFSSKVGGAKERVTAALSGIGSHAG